MKRRPLIVAVHGILTRTTSPSWPDRLDAFFADVKVVKKEYLAGPLPIWNVFAKNRILARALAGELELFGPAWSLHFVAHSNGCDIALKTIRRLARRGIRTETAILTGSVTDPDARASGVEELIRANSLGRAFAYCSRSDWPLRLSPVIAWPYRDLGREGWTNVPDDLRRRIVTVRMDGFGHGDYFSDEYREIVFRQMRADMELVDVPARER